MARRRSNASSVNTAGRTAGPVRNPPGLTCRSSGTAHAVVLTIVFPGTPGPRASVQQWIRRILRERAGLSSEPTNLGSSGESAPALFRSAEIRRCSVRDPVLPRSADRGCRGGKSSPARSSENTYADPYGLLTTADRRFGSPVGKPYSRLGGAVRHYGSVQKRGWSPSSTERGESASLAFFTVPSVQHSI